MACKVPRVSGTLGIMSIQLVPEGRRPVDTLQLRLAIARHLAGGLSAEAAGARVGVSGQTWRNWESGETQGAAKPAMLAYIAQRLEVDLDWLENGGSLLPPSTTPPDGTTPGGPGFGSRRGYAETQPIRGDVSAMSDPALFEPAA